MDSTILCEDCKTWIHYLCSGLPMYQLLCFARTHRKFTCESCSMDKYGDAKWIQEADLAMQRQGRKKQSQVGTPETDTDTNDSHGDRSEEKDTPVRENQGLGGQESLGSSPEDINFNITLSEVVSGQNQTQVQFREENRHTPNNNTEVAGYNLAGNAQGKPAHKERKVQICKYYRNNKCRYGISGTGCEYPHPKACVKFMSHGMDNKLGCTLGWKCTDYHPLVCRGSLHKGVCVRRACKYTHIKGTQRQGFVLQTETVGKQREDCDKQECRQHGITTNNKPNRQQHQSATHNTEPTQSRWIDTVEESAQTSNEINSLILPPNTDQTTTFLEKMMMQFLDMQKQSKAMFSHLVERLDKVEMRQRGGYTFHL